MQTFGKTHGYTEYDHISFPEEILALGVATGDEGIVERLDYRRNNVYADVTVTYTRQPRSSVLMQITPEEKVLSYSSIA